MKRKGIFFHICVRIIPLTLVFLLAIYLLSQNAITTQLEEGLKTRVEVEASNTSHTLSDRHRWLESILVSLAKNDIVINALVDAGGRNSYIVPFFRSYQIPSLPDAKISLLDYRGRAIASNSEKKSYQEQPWIESVSGGEFHREISLDALILASPVRYGGMPEGMIVLELGHEHFAEYFEPAVRQKRIVITDEGNAIHHASDSGFGRFGERFSATAFPAWEFSEAVNEGDLGLKVFSAVSRAEIGAGQSELRRSLFVIASICLTALLAAIFLTARTAIGPLKLFLKYLRETPDTDLPATGPREFESLAGAYNELSDRRRVVQRQLRELNNGLEKKVAERTEELERSNEELEKLARIAETTDNAVILTDKDGYIEWVNEGFLRIAEYPLDEVYGKKPGEILQGPDTDPETVAYMRSCLSRGEGFATQILNYSRSGRPYWLDLRVQAIRNKDGELTHFMAIESDITDRKDRERRLRESLESQKTLNAILELSLSDTPLKSKLENAFDIILQAGSPRHRQSGGIFLVSSGEVRTIELSVERALDGSERLLQSMSREFGSTRDGLDENGYYWARVLDGEEMLGVLLLSLEQQNELSEFETEYLQAITNALAALIVRDRAVNDLKAARELAEEGTRAKSEFLACMSHELRTPMNSIIGFTQRLIKKIGSSVSERDRDALLTVDRNAKHLLTLINDILDLSKIEAGKMRLEESHFDLCAIVRGIVSALEPLSGAKGLKIGSHFPGAAIPVSADRTKITQVITNLLSNAIKYTDSGSIDISLGVNPNALPSGEVLIAVKDTGMGIRQGDLERLFEKFTQLDLEEGRRKGGTGLGLVIAKQYVEMHGGRIEVKSTWGEGSEFTLHLPIVAELQSDLELPFEEAPQGDGG